jgi:hypothetical protein
MARCTIIIEDCGPSEFESVVSFEPKVPPGTAFRDMTVSQNIGHSVMLHIQRISLGEVPLAPNWDSLATLRLQLFGIFSKMPVPLAKQMVAFLKFHVDGENN